MLKFSSLNPEGSETLLVAAGDGSLAAGDGSLVAVAGPDTPGRHTNPVLEVTHLYKESKHHKRQCVHTLKTPRHL